MKRIRLLQVVGARPQFIKLAPLSRAIRGRGQQLEELIVHTGQHYDPQLSDVFFRELDLPHPSVNLEVGSGPHGQQTGAILERVESYLLETQPDVVVVYGDTNSTLAGTLAAAKLCIPVAHIEAGLRSHNRAMPEELNRVATDHLSDLLLAPTEAAMRNLGEEGLAARSRLVGDVMYDAVLANAALAQRRSRILETLGLAERGYGLVTIHRAESTHPRALPLVLELLAAIATSLVPLVLPLHPRTRDAMQNLPSWRPPGELMLIEPLGPLDMLRITAGAAVVLTDSGGLQKEAFMLGRPCVTLRSETEWVETVAAGANTVVGHDAAAAAAAVARALRAQTAADTAGTLQVQASYGNGNAAVRCLDEILALADGARHHGMT